MNVRWSLSTIFLLSALLFSGSAEIKRKPKTCLQLAHHLFLWITSLILALYLSPPSALGLDITFSGAPGNVAIVDNGPGDSNPAVGVIGFSVTPVIGGVFFGWGATGTLRETVVMPSPVFPFGGGSATLLLTDLVIGQGGGPPLFLQTISFNSSVFAAIDGVLGTSLKVHLDGDFVKVGPSGVLPPGGTINGSAVELTGYYNTTKLIGTVSAGPAAGVPSNVPFAPPDEEAFVVFLGPGVTSLHGVLNFNLGTADGISLPDSAVVTVVGFPTPEPNTLLLLATGLAVFCAPGWGWPAIKFSFRRR